MVKRALMFLHIERDQRRRIAIFGATRKRRQGKKNEGERNCNVAATLTLDMF
jgi:hypothetical protein